METAVTPQLLKEVSCDILAVNLFEGEKPAEGPLQGLDALLGGSLSRCVEWGEITGKLHQMVLTPTGGAVAAPRVLLVGAGPSAEFAPEQARAAAGAAARYARERGGRHLALYWRGIEEAEIRARAVAEGVLLALYEPDQYKTRGRDERQIERLTVVVDQASQVAPAQAGVEVGTILGEATNYTRRLVSEPANAMTPTALAEEARQLARNYGLECQVLDRDRMAQLGMGGILGVAQGSEQPPYLITLLYPGTPKSTQALGLVGKGVTFDSGGISIKPSDHMEEMKMDMAGAAAVLGAMRAVAQRKPPSNVLGVIPAVENMPGGRASRPGDVLRTLSGKTIEVISTDAEGRMILADALWYAQQQGASRLVDIATLTGACVIALGHITTGIMGAPQGWVEEVLRAAEEAGEKMWQLPLFPEYREQIKSDIADIKNSGGRPAGTITGAWFLKEFVKEDVPWAHLDIAGTVWLEKATAYLAKGPSGVGVRTLANLAMRQ